MVKVKRIFAIALVVILLLSLTSCAELDRIRERHAIITSKTPLTITLNGTQYIAIDYLNRGYEKQELFDPLLEQPMYEAYVTEENVPTLMAPLWSPIHYISKDKAIIIDQYYSSLYMRADLISVYGLEDWLLNVE